MRHKNRLSPAAKAALDRALSRSEARDRALAARRAPAAPAAFEPFEDDYDWSETYEVPPAVTAAPKKDHAWLYDLLSR